MKTKNKTLITGKSQAILTTSAFKKHRMQSLGYLEEAQSNGKGGNGRGLGKWSQYI